MNGRQQWWRLRGAATRKSILSLVTLLMLMAAVIAAAALQTGSASLRGSALKFKAAPALPENEGAARSDEPLQAERFEILRRAKDVVLDRSAPGDHMTSYTPISFDLYAAALAHNNRMPRYSTRDNKRLPPGEAQGLLTPWTKLGPGNIGGRTRAVVINPTDANTIYSGAADGGVWKTTDGGANWAPLNDLLPNLAVNALAMDPADPNTLYAGTGEGFFNGDAIRGAGIFKTTNGGTSWTTIGGTGTSSDFQFVNDIIVSPNSPLRVYAATTTGLFRSLDAGASWTNVLVPAQPNGCTDLAVRTDIGPTDTVFAGCGQFSSGAVYRNTDAGGAGVWTSVLAEAGMARVSLAIAPSNQAVIYALSAENSAGGALAHGLHAVHRSTTGGASGSWTAQVTNASATPLNRMLLTNPLFAFTECVGASQGLFNQGWYDNVIAVDPADSNRVWTGGIDLFRSDNGGVDWGEASRWFDNGGVWGQFAHADQHAIVFHPLYNGTTNKTMFVGNDGGIFRTTDARAAVAFGNTAPCSTTGSMSYTALNNSFAITQFYDGVPYPSGTTYFGGTQDNGTVRGTDGGGANAWSTLLGGDGGSVAVDPSNTLNLYGEFTRLSIQKSTNGGSTWASAISGITESGNNFLFIAPFIMDPSTSTTLWTGGFFIWRTTNGASSWVQASTVTAGLGSVSALATAPTNANRALVGMSDGFIHRNSAALSATSATSWPVVQPRAGFVDGLAFDPANDLVAYATYSTFGGTHVWKTTDGGATWVGIDGTGVTGLPDIPVHTIAIDPTNSTRLYVGTDLGVYVSLDGGVNWAVENSGFANVNTETLWVNTIGPTRTLFAFTHGRGAYRVNLATPTAVAVTSFAARKTRSGVLVSWRTGAEAKMLGFNVYRGQTTKGWRKLNRTLIPAKAAAGAIYRFLDRTAKRGQAYKYRLQIVDLNGKRSWHTVGAVS